jgi:hypothetical protein
MAIFGRNKYCRVTSQRQMSSPLIAVILMIFLPILLWMVSPVWLQPGLIATGLVIVLCAIFVFVFRFWHEIVDFNASPFKADHHWRSGLKPQTYKDHLVVYLKDRGWKILKSRIIDPQRISFSIQKDKIIAVLLFLGPEYRPGEQDLAQLAAWRTEARAQNAAMISGTKPQDSAFLSRQDRQTFVLTYEDMKDMDQLFQVLN